MIDPHYVYALFAFVLGALVGSFLNVCIFRLPKGESVVSPPSHCLNCGYRIRWYDNIPVLSYLFLGGKCRSCKTSISLQYPVVELINAFLSLFLFLRFGPGIVFAVLFVLCSSLVAITFIDLEHQIIPDVITLPGIVLGFLISLLIPQLGWVNSLMGIVVGGGSLLLVAFIYQLVTKKDGMGGGDIKLLAMMGAFLGWKAIPFIVFVSSLLGSVIGIAVMLLQKKDSKLAIPFGPFLASAAVLYIFFGRSIIVWYLSLGR